MATFRGVDRELYEIEVLDGELVEERPVLAPPAQEPRAVSRVTSPGVQTAVAATAGFVAGAATLALLHHYGLARLERAAAAAREQVQPPAGRARTFIVHVRPLG